MKLTTAVLGRGGEPDEHGAGVAQTRHFGAVELGDGAGFGVRHRRVRVGPPLHLGELLDAHRDAGERAGVVAGGDALVDALGVGPRPIRVEEAHRVELRIEALDPRQRELQQVPGAQLTRTDAIGELPRVVLP